MLHILFRNQDQSFLNGFSSDPVRAFYLHLAIKRMNQYQLELCVPIIFYLEYKALDANRDIERKPLPYPKPPMNQSQPQITPLISPPHTRSRSRSQSRSPQLLPKPLSRFLTISTTSNPNLLAVFSSILPVSAIRTMIAPQSFLISTPPSLFISSGPTLVT